MGQCCWPEKKDVVTDDIIQIDNSSEDETIIYDFQTDENQNERYVVCKVHFSVYF